MNEKVSVLKHVMTAAAATLAFGTGAPAMADNADSRIQTPANFPYDLDEKRRRIPKAGTRVPQADGSWIEEIKKGNCTITRTGRGDSVLQVQEKCS